MTPHGSVSTYTNLACRCAACREVWATYTAARKAERRRWVAANGLPNSVEHGYSAYVNWGCRCGICRAASAQQSRRARRRFGAS